VSTQLEKPSFSSKGVQIFEERQTLTLLWSTKFRITQYLSPSSFDLTLAEKLTPPSLLMVIFASFIEQSPARLRMTCVQPALVLPDKS
jgi:hypothetical protein